MFSRFCQLLLDVAWASIDSDLIQSVKIINFVNIDSTSASIVPIFDMFLLKLYPLSNSINAWFGGKQGVE